MVRFWSAATQGSVQKPCEQNFGLFYPPFPLMYNSLNRTCKVTLTFHDPSLALSPCLFTWFMNGPKRCQKILGVINETKLWEKMSLIFLRVYRFSWIKEKKKVVVPNTPHFFKAAPARPGQPCIKHFFVVVLFRFR